MNNVKRVAAELNRIADTIDASKNPDRRLVAADLSGVLKSLTASKRRTAAWDWSGLSKAWEGAQKSIKKISDAIENEDMEELEMQVGAVKSTIDQMAKDTEG